MGERKCNRCGQTIDPERLEALPDTQHCVGCSTTKQKLVLMVQEGKTAAYAVSIDTNGSVGGERVRQAWRAHRRGR